jgi:hypothetical protein
MCALRFQIAMLTKNKPEINAILNASAISSVYAQNTPSGRVDRSLIPCAL